MHTCVQCVFDIGLYIHIYIYNTIYIRHIYIHDTIYVHICCFLSLFIFKNMAGMVSPIEALRDAEADIKDR
jgi:hypothetical protein